MLQKDIEFLFELNKKCADSWFDRFYRFREKYYANDREITDDELAHLDYLYGKYQMFQSRAQACLTLT